jgi:hypothetical protein
MQVNCRRPYQSEAQWRDLQFTLWRFKPNGSIALRFVIPSAVEGSAPNHRAMRMKRPICFLKARKPARQAQLSPEGLGSHTPT